MRDRRFALVAGGGTGGHLVPALAVARALGHERGPASVEVVGARRGIDAALLAGEGIPVTLLPGRGLLRRADPRSLLANLGALGALGAALAAAVVLVARRRPAVVVATGGYACVPTALAAALLGVPVVLVNVDAVPGAANRLVSRFARAVAVGFEGTALPRAVVTGIPVRAEIVAAAGPDRGARTKARAALGLPEDRVVVAVVGGSLGARRVNEATVALARLWQDRADVALFHVVGRRDASWASAALGPAPLDRAGVDRAGVDEAPAATGGAADPGGRAGPGDRADGTSSVRAPAGGGRGLRYVQVPYEEHMALFYRAADVVVARAGANTVAELAVVGVPSVLVPLPGAPGDHQRANAEVLARAGGAVVVPDPECSAPRLAAEIDAILAEPGRLESMGAGARSVGRPEALAAVVDLTVSCARRPRAAPAAHAR